MRMLISIAIVFTTALPALAQSSLAELANAEAARRHTRASASRVYSNADLKVGPTRPPVRPPLSAHAIYEHFLERQRARDQAPGPVFVVVPYDRWWPFVGPPEPIQPLAPPWQMTVYLRGSQERRRHQPRAR